MSKESLKEPYGSIESNAIKAMIEGGLKRWRSDLNYPESYSDMQACFRGLLAMFEVTPRSQPFDIKDAWEPEIKAAWDREQENKILYSHRKFELDKKMKQ